MRCLLKIQYFLLQQAEFCQGYLNFGSLEGVRGSDEGFPAIQESGLGYFYPFEKNVTIGFP